MTFALDDTFDILERTPLALRDQMGALATEWTEARPNPENWSAFQVLCHMAYIEEHDWLVRARMIVEVGTAEAFPPVDHGDQSARYAGLTADEVLERFSTLRQRNLEAVRPLLDDPSVLDQRGLHPSLGEVTMRELLSAWAVHDLNHLRQAQQAMATRYRDAVGPWKVNLGILDSATG